MKYKLPMLPVVVLSMLLPGRVVAQPAPITQQPTAQFAQPRAVADAPGVPETVDGQALVEQVARELAQLNSLQAKLTQRVDVLGQQLVGSGQYWQLSSGPDPLLRLDLKLQLAGQISSIQQICDGQIIWVRRDLHGQSQLGRIDLDRVRAKLKERGENFAAHDPLWIVSGGLPKLFHALSENFQFSAARAERMQAPSSELNVWVVEGRWKPEPLVRLVPEAQQVFEQGRYPGPETLPPHVPDQVVLVLSRDPSLPLLPYRLEYRRSQPPSADNKPQRARALVSIDFYDVVLNPPLEPHQFRYAPGDQPIVDQTELYLKSLP